MHEEKEETGAGCGGGILTIGLVLAMIDHSSLLCCHIAAGCAFLLCFVSDNEDAWKGSLGLAAVIWAITYWLMTK